MKGVGGPLLCVGDVLRDLSEDAGDSDTAASPASASTRDSSPLPPAHLLNLFEETYDHLTKSLEGTDHSWTQLTLNLCSAVEAAQKLTSLAHSNTEVLLEMVDNLESIVKRCHSVVEAARPLSRDEPERESAGQ